MQAARRIAALAKDGRLDPAALVRGVDTYHHFAHEPRPATEWDAAGVALQEKAADAQRRILYTGTDREAFRADI